jgi:hypothetical protein
MTDPSNHDHPAGTIAHAVTAQPAVKSRAAYSPQPFLSLGRIFAIVCMSADYSKNGRPIRNPGS